MAQVPQVRVADVLRIRMPRTFDQFALVPIRQNYTDIEGRRWHGVGMTMFTYPGLRVASSLAGYRRDGYSLPAKNVLLVAVKRAERYYDVGDIHRYNRVAVLAYVDFERFLHDHGRGLHLYGADLRTLNLEGADLTGSVTDRALLAS